MKDPRIGMPAPTEAQLARVEELGWRLDSDWSPEVWDGDTRLTIGMTMRVAIEKALELYDNCSPECHVLSREAGTKMHVAPCPLGPVPLADVCTPTCRAASREIGETVHLAPCPLSPDPTAVEGLSCLGDCGRYVDDANSPGTLPVGKLKEKSMGDLRLTFEKLAAQAAELEWALGIVIRQNPQTVGHELNERLMQLNEARDQALERWKATEKSDAA